MNAPIDYQGARATQDLLEFAKNNMDVIIKVQGPSGNEYSKINDVIRLTKSNHQSALQDFPKICVQYFKSCSKCSLFPPKWARISRDLAE